MKASSAIAVLAAVLAGATPLPIESTGRPGDSQMQLTASGLPSWLAGCWVRQSGSLTIEEMWMAPRGGVMLGMGRTTREDHVVEFEHLRIYQRGDSLVYHARPSGQADAEFVSSRLVSDSVTFSNPAHDFPQRVIYRRRGADSLLARIEGTANGRARGVDFQYARTSCPGD